MKAIGRVALPFVIRGLTDKQIESMSMIEFAHNVENGDFVSCSSYCHFFLLLQSVTPSLFFHSAPALYFGGFLILEFAVTSEIFKLPSSIEGFGVSTFLCVEFPRLLYRVSVAGSYVQVQGR